MLTIRPDRSPCGACGATVYDLLEEPPPILVAAGDPLSAGPAARIGDGLTGVAPLPRLVERFEAAGGKGKPRYGQLNVCWAEDAVEARRTAHRLWPIAGLEGALLSELRWLKHVEEAADLADEEDMAAKVVRGPDPERHPEAIRKFAAAGFDHIVVHQSGPDREGFFRFYEREILPRCR